MRFFVCRYSSYNRDDGFDLYEGEFIDDSDVSFTPTPRRRRKRKQRKTISDSNSSSSSDVGGQRSKRKPATVQFSSDEEISPIKHDCENEQPKANLTNENMSDNANLRAAVNRDSGTSSEEGIKKVRKKRRIQCPESDEELRSV